MAGPVWRFDPEREGTCDNCLRKSKGVFIEGELTDNALEPVRLICQDCISRRKSLIVSGEAGGHARSPAYARDP